MIYAARFFIFRAVINPPDARKGYRGSTHWAWLKCGVKIAILQTFALQQFAGLANCQHFRVRRRIIKFNDPVSRACQNSAIWASDDRSYGNFTALCGPRGLFKRQCHMICHNNCLVFPGASGQGLCYQSGMNDVKAKPQGERIAKRIARAGLCSRRDAERMIAAGQVKVNGKTLTSPAFNVSAADAIEVNGQPLPDAGASRLWRYHKPAGLVTSHKDPEGRPTVFEKIPDDLPRVISVGRLDYNTEGLLLLTNDGGLARTLELPSTGWVRRYRVRAFGSIDQSKLDSLKHGIEIDGIRYGPIEASIDKVQRGNLWLGISLKEGKNREIKKVFEHLGLKVNRLIRLSFGPFQLGDLPVGKADEIKPSVLRDQLGQKLSGMPDKMPKSQKPRKQRKSNAHRRRNP